MILGHQLVDLVLELHSVSVNMQTTFRFPCNRVVLLFLVVKLPASEHILGMLDLLVGVPKDVAS